MGLHSVEGILTSFSKEDGKDTYGAKVTSITKQDGSKKVTLTDAKEEFTKIAKDYVALKNNKVKGSVQGHRRSLRRICSDRLQQGYLWPAG